MSSEMSSSGVGTDVAASVVDRTKGSFLFPDSMRIGNHSRSFQRRFGDLGAHAADTLPQVKMPNRDGRRAESSKTQ